MNGYLSSEVMRARNSTLQWLPLIAMPFLALILIMQVSVDPRANVEAILNWQAIYLTGLAAPVAALFAASAESREKQARFGGTLWRDTSAQRQRAARLIVVLLSLFAFHLLNYGGAWAFAAMMGRIGSGRLLYLGMLAFIGVVGIAGLASALARLTNLIVPVIVFLLWQMVGVFRNVVEGDFWWAWPMAWPVRLILPVAGIHQNAVALEPDSPLRAEKPWLALGLCALLALIGIGAALLTPEQTLQVKKRFKERAVPRPAVALRSYGSAAAVALRSDARRPRPYAAITPAVMNAALLGCTAFALLVMVVAAMFYPVTILHGLFTYAVLPIGAGLMPVIIWPRLQKVWPLMLTEYANSARVVLTWMLAYLALVASIAAGLGLLAGGTFADEGRRFVLFAIVGGIVILISTQLVLRTGAATAISAVLFMVILSVLVGGDVLAQTMLWVFAFPAWPESATTPLRLTIAGILGTVMLLVLWMRTQRLLERLIELVHS